MPKFRRYVFMTRSRTNDECLIPVAANWSFSSRVGGYLGRSGKAVSGARGKAGNEMGDFKGN